MSDDTGNESKASVPKFAPEAKAMIREAFGENQTPNLLEEFLHRVEEGFQAALSQAEALVKLKRQELADAEAQLEKVRQYDPNRKATSSSAPRSERATSTSSGSRAPRGSVQRRILDELAKHPDGLTRSGLIEALSVKGVKKEEASISNALPGLSKTGKIGRKERGVYVLA